MASEGALQQCRVVAGPYRRDGILLDSVCCSRAVSPTTQARVSLLRTLASEPKVVLLDEPVSQLDTTLREHIRAWTFTTLKEQGVAALLVTHDADDATAANGDIIELTPC